ncbi:MAG: hypothetical protein LUD22_03475, partial [Coprobacillus sp.]|nr:hypothetical protein [Coprobacillus sp.]
MKKGTKALMLLPLIAICLSGCYEIIPEDAPEEIEDEFTPEGSYTLPEENSDYTESSSIPYESTGGDSSSTPSETPGGDTSSPSETPGGDSSSDSTKPSEPDDPTGPSESSSSSSSTPSETHEYSYSLVIENKEDLASLTLDENNSSSNTYTLSISLISYDYDIQLSCEAATEDVVTITSSNEAAVIVDGLTLIPQVGGGETTISATWNLHSEATDSFGVSVDYIPYTPEESYEYKLVIENKEELGSTWKITDTKQEVDHTLIVKLYEYKYLDGELADDYPLTSEASLSDVDIAFTDDSVLGISNDSISFYPTGVGSTDVTLTWIEHEEATDTFNVIVEEVTYEYNHTLAITNADEFAYTDDDNVWRVGDSYKTLSVLLTSTTYLGSTDTSIESTIVGDATNVSVSITPEEGSPEDGLTVFGLNLMANSAGTYTVTATWTGHEEATDSITVLVKEKTSESYTMSVSSEDVSSIEAPWYVEDEESRSFSINIDADDGEAVDLPYNDDDIIVLHSSSQLQIDSKVSGGIITITPVGITSDATITLFVYWSLHSEAHITLTLSLNQHAYEISITNADELATDWSVEDGYRTVAIQATKDGTTYEQDPYIELIPGSDDSDSITIDGLNITPVSEGNPTVTAVWYKYDPSDPTYADSNVVYAVSNTVQLSIDENIKPVSISLSEESITLNAYYDTETLSATVLGASGEQATEQGVTWSVDNTGITISNASDDNSITVSVTGYNIEGTITCTSEKDPSVSASCTVSIGSQPNPNGPQVGDTTYKLGCKSGDSYLFFDGTTSSSHLQTTEDWDSAVDVYITPNVYEIGGNGCTLSFYDGNGTLQYIASSESSSNKGNMKLSTTPYRWVWDSYNGHSFFATPAFEDRYIGYSGSDFRTYAQSNLSSYAPAYPYLEVPEDYEQEQEPEPEPEPGDDDQEEGLLGKFDFTAVSVSTGTGASASDIDSFWTGDTSIYSGCQTANTIYLGNNNSGGLTGSGFIRASSSGTNGQLVFKFVVGVKIQKVVISAQAWSGDSSSISVNGSASQSVSSGSFSDLTFDISDDYVYKLTIDFTKRSFIQDIKIYGEYDPDNLPEVTSLTINADKTTINVNEEVEVSVTWEPTDAVIDPDNLIWNSTDSSVAIGESTANGTFIKGIGSGTASISATTEDNKATSNTIEITVADTLEDSETFVSSELGYDNATEVPSIEGHQVTITFALGTQSTASNVP